MNDLVTEEIRAERGRKTIGHNAYISRMQRRHFLIFDVIPNVCLVAAIPLCFFIAVEMSDLIVFFTMWGLTGIGVTVGYHRLFTHRAFTAPAAVRVTLAFLGALAGQGPAVSWAAIHRRHHELSDQPGDLHSPNLHGKTFGGRLKGLLHAHYTWMFEHDYPNTAHYTADLLRDRAIVRVNRRYYPIATAGLFVPGLLCGLIVGSWHAAFSGVLWGGFIRMAVLGHTIWAINSFLHVSGSRPFTTSDNSHNAGLFSLLSFGESWHNNHHAFPGSANFGLGHGWSDPGWWVVLGLARLGLATDLRLPTNQAIDRRLNSRNSS